MNPKRPPRGLYTNWVPPESSTSGPLRFVHMLVEPTCHNDHTPARWSVPPLGNFWSARQGFQALSLGEDRIGLRLTSVCAIGGAVWSAAACCRFCSGQLAGRAALRRSLGDEAASKLAGESGSKLPLSRTRLPTAVRRAFERNEVRAAVHVHDPQRRLRW